MITRILLLLFSRYTDRFELFSDLFYPEIQPTKAAPLSICRRIKIIETQLLIPAAFPCDYFYPAE